MNDQELLQIVDEEWGVYRRAGRREKLAMLRHRFSMFIPHEDDMYVFLHVVLDDHEVLVYMVNKAAVIGDSHSMKGFARFVFALG